MAANRKKFWPRIILNELISFIEEQHGTLPSLEDISDKTGLSVGNISAIFIRDDMKLRRAEEIVRAYGYELKLFFPLREYPQDWGTHISRREFPNSGNLTGLVKYLYDSNITVNYMCKRIGCSYTMLDNAFTTGNISLSYLYKITENLNINVLWIYEKKNSE